MINYGPAVHLKITQALAESEEIALACICVQVLIHVQLFFVVTSVLHIFLWQDLLCRCRVEVAHGLTELFLKCAVIQSVGKKYSPGRPLV